MATLNRKYLDSKTEKPILHTNTGQVKCFRIGENHYILLLELMETNFFFSISEAIRFASLFYLNQFKEVKQNSLVHIDDISKRQFLQNYSKERKDTWKPIPYSRASKTGFRQLRLSVKFHPDFIDVIDNFSLSNRIDSRSDFFRTAIEFTYINFKVI